MTDEPIQGPFVPRMADEPDQCANCVFWFNPDATELGLCRCHAPAVFVVGSQTMMNGSSAAITQSFHPPMPKIGWCGEHRRRP